MIEISDHRDIDAAFKDIDLQATRAINSGKSLYLSYGTDRGMTQAQRGSLHVWCEQVAIALNDAGLSMIAKSIFGDRNIEIDWTMLLVKERIYKPTLESMTGKKSTEKQTTVNPSDVVNHLIRYFSEHGVIIPGWPSKR